MHINFGKQLHMQHISEYTENTFSGMHFMNRIFRLIFLSL